MNKLIIILILTTLFASCLNMNPPETQASFINARKKFADTLVNHIPKKLPNNQVGYSFTSNESTATNSGINLKIKCRTNEEFNQLKEQYKKQNRILNSKSDCIFTINDSYTDFGKKYAQEKCSNTIPVPQYIYYTYKTDFEEKEINSEFEIIILNSRPGIYKKEINEKESFDYPLNWIHGFSKGITFNSDTRIVNFWLIIW